MTRLSLVLLAGLLTVLVQAQDATLLGLVVDSISRQAIIGANVIYAPGKGAATDVDGRYSVTFPAGEHVVTFSSIGYQMNKTTITLAPGEIRELDMALSPAVTQLDMVVVTAGRFEQRVGEVTQSLSVIQPDLVLNKNIVSMDDALEQVPGVVIMDGEPQIRAGSGFSFGAGSRVQVLIDDIPILSGDVGRPNWTFLPLENLEQVEVIKGASSVLYGSAALGGVINVRTAYPRDKPRTRVTMFTGIYDKPRREEARWYGENNPMISGVNFFHSQQFGNFDLVFGGNAFSDAGYVGPEPVPADSIARDPLRLGPAGYDNRIRFNTALRWRNKKVDGLNYGVNANVMKSRSTAILIWNDIDSGIYRPKPGTVTRTIGAQYYIDPFINYHSKAGTKHSLRTRLHHQDFENDNDQSNSNTVSHAEYQVQQTADIFGETVFTLGVLYRNTESTAALYSGDEDGDGRNSALNTAAYVQMDKRLLERVSISAGLRYERFTVNELDDAEPVFRAGVNWQVLNATYLRASYGQGFRFPTIGERFINTSVGNLRILPSPDIRAEKSTNIEGGVKQGFRIGGFEGYLDAVVFQQDYRDFVEFTFARWTNSGLLSEVFGLGFKSVNTGDARVTGYELELAGQGALGQIQIGTLIGYTYTLPVTTTPDHVYAEPPGGAVSYNSTSYDPSDNILKFRVQHLFRSDLQLSYRRVFTGVSVRYNSHVRNIDKIFVDLDDPELSFIDLQTGVSDWMRTHRSGDTIIDVRLGMKLSDLVRLTFIVNNLTNLEYATRPLAIEAPRNYQVQMILDL